MATVIDELVLKLGLDTSQFTKGQQEAFAAASKFVENLQKHGKEVESQGKKLVDFFSTLKREVLTFVGVSFGGAEFKNMINNITNFDAATDRMAKTVGVNTEVMSQWKYAIQQVGGEAEDATATIAGISHAVQDFFRGNTGAISPQFGNILQQLNVKNIQDPIEVLQKAHDFITKNYKGNAPGATAWLSGIPGMNQSMVNFMLDPNFQKMLDSAAKIGGTTANSAAAAEQYITASKKLEQSFTNLGRIITVIVTPALSAISDSLTTLFSAWTAAPGSPEAKAVEDKFNADLKKHFGSSTAFKMGLMGYVPADSGGDSTQGGPTVTYPTRHPINDRRFHNPNAAASTTPGTPTAGDPRGKIPLIKEAFAAEGVDPSLGVKVAQSEGLASFLSGIPGEASFGAFQLHTGGGLGDIFQKETGLDPSDPKNEDATIRWAAKYIAKHGWGPWMGARKIGVTGMMGINAANASALGKGNTSTSNNSTSNNINNMNIYGANDGTKFAGDFSTALSRTSTAFSAEGGLQ